MIRMYDVTYTVRGVTFNRRLTDYEYRALRIALERRYPNLKITAKEVTR